MRLPAVIARLLPDIGAVSAAERCRASLGAMLGLLVTGLVSRAALGSVDSLPLLIAPMGASAVLLFAVPSSPLAQPWSILGGNVVSALIGVTAARSIPDPIAAAAVGGALAIAAMMMLRCLHPPSGAVALTAVLGGPAVRAAGYGFVIWPVGLNSVLLLAVALAFNNLTGRRYPHRPAARAGAADAAVARVLRRHDAVVDIGRHDLAALLDEVGADRGGVFRCADLMRSEPDALPAATSLDAALDRMAAVKRTALPVVDAAGRCIGLVHQGGLVRHLRPTRTGRRVAQLFRRSLRFDLGPASVGGLVEPVPVSAAAETPLMALLEAMVESSADYCPVLGPDEAILGAVTQGDLLRWLAGRQGEVGRPAAQARQPSSVIQRL